MCWDPVIYNAVHAVCVRESIETFGHGLNAKTGEPLFNKKAWAKVKSVLELAHEGYLSDIKGVVLYKKVGINSHGLQTYKCLRGTNKVERGPHADIYKKFGALHGMSIWSLHTFVYSHNLYS